MTTAELLAMEAEILAVAERAKGARAGLVELGVVDAVLAERPSIANEQAAMVGRLTTSGAGVEVVIGKAGAGKTYALDAARAAWQRGGFRVQGAALAARAAAELESGAGICSTTLARLFSGIDRGDIVFGPRDVVVLDEAGMVGSRALHRLVISVTRADGKLVACGDLASSPRSRPAEGYGSSPSASGPPSSSRTAGRKPTGSAMPSTSCDTAGSTPASPPTRSTAASTASTRPGRLASPWWRSGRSVARVVVMRACTPFAAATSRT